MSKALTKLGVCIDIVEICWANFVDFWQSSACNMSIFLFPADNFNKCQRIFTELGMCIDIVEIWFGVADG